MATSCKLRVRAGAQISKALDGAKTFMKTPREIVVGFATILILDLIQTIYYSSANTNETSKLVSH